MGLVNPGTVNVIGWSELNLPEVNVIVKTFAADSPAVPAGAGLELGKGEENVSAAEPELASAMPGPVSVMMIFPLLGTGATGMSVMLMMTPVAPLATLLSAIETEPPGFVLLTDPVLIAPAEQELDVVTT